ncbi:MAG: hypothetical protein B5M51_03505 [Anaerolinea sp. 4484_236]|nr:MAG: hypothetical protein B5M51_03505 [Anaerolinea sp. 4484_236]
MAANPKLADFARRALFDDTCAARLAVQGSNLMGRGTASSQEHAPRTRARKGRVIFDSTAKTEFFREANKKPPTLSS